MNGGIGGDERGYNGIGRDRLMQQLRNHPLGRHNLRDGASPFATRRAAMAIGDVVAIIQGSVALIRLIDDSFRFYKECRDLKARCENIRSLLEDNRDVFEQNEVKGIDGLKAVVEEASKYLENKKTGWLYRNPFVEKVFFLRIDKFEKGLDSGIATLTLSLSVRRYLYFSNCCRKTP